jgi:hypothetical protein
MASRLPHVFVSSVRLCVVVLGLLGFATGGSAQSPNATLAGTVVDATTAALPSVELVAINLDTGRTQRASSGADGGFVLSSLPPGRYMLRATLPQFAPTELRNLILNVGDRLAITVAMDLASLGESTTIVADGSSVNTSPAVATVVDREFVQNMPLNGRSLQSLLELTPGVVLVNGGSGFSVNGQRTTSNYLTVDGVSANVGIAASGGLPSSAGSGQTPGYTAVGTTAGLVAVDALQEFRIETSTYAPEFGRMPGGQVSFVTRSGTNELHGSAFEYFRHDALDATDWFVNNKGQPKPKLRQHDFGGVAGGPLLRNRTFIFGSYEGLSLMQPRVAIAAVMTPEARAVVSPSLRAYVDAYPLPNGPSTGPGVAEFAASWSDPSRVDTASVRMDHNLSQQTRLFGRVSLMRSFREVRTLSHVQTTDSDNTAITVGATSVIAMKLLHDARLNYTSAGSPIWFQPDDFRGAIPPPVSVFEQGRTPDDTRFTFVIPSAGGAWNWGVGTRYGQRQLNVVDSLTLTTASHELKAGIDYRWLNPDLQGRGLSSQTINTTIPLIQAGRATSYSAVVSRQTGGSARFDNLSVYLQDTWRVFRRLTLTYGIRWDLVPPPRATEGIQPVTVNGLDNPLGELSLAESGTPLWKTRYSNIAPRFGGSYVVSDRLGWQLTARGGLGVFYDLGYGPIANAFAGYPFTAFKSSAMPSLPLSSDVTSPPDFDAQPPSNLFVADRNLQTPVTYQWNVAVEQALGKRRSLTISYVGSEGRDLLKNDSRRSSLREWPGATRSPVNVITNNAHADYRALQLQFQQRLHRGVQAVASYSWGRSRDTVSNDTAGGTPNDLVPVQGDYGYSDFDVRHNFSAAVSYQRPAAVGSLLSRALGGWAIDVLLRARSGSPVRVITTNQFASGLVLSVRPNLVPGNNIWISDDTAPGGRRLNRAAFAAPEAGTQGNLTRGIVRGFPARQVDLAVRRELPLVGALRAQLRFEMFNVLNTPNFGNPQEVLNSTLFGVSTTSLSQALDPVNAIYQVGGSRSTQLAVRLSF